MPAGNPTEYAYHPQDRTVEREIPRLVQTVGSLTRELSEALGHLVERLTPVLTDRDLHAVEPDRPGEPALTPVGQELSNHVRALEASVGAVAQLSRRLGL